MRKEAVLSSQIEDTQSSLADLRLYEIDEQPGVPVADTREVSRCVVALEHGLQALRGGLPLSMRPMSMRIVCGMHEVLMAHPGGRSKTPGEVRRSQVWIGRTRPGNAAFVPPLSNRLAECLKPFERFLNDEPEQTSPLIKAALAHVQFETIHPFLDGNGRLGRLLIVLQLVADGVLREPMLYPSLFLKTHGALYYELLTEVRLHGDWERWLEFFAQGVQASATQAVATAHALLALVNADRDRIASLGRAAGSALAAPSAAAPTARHLKRARESHRADGSDGEQVARAPGAIGHRRRVDEPASGAGVRVSALCGRAGSGAGWRRVKPPAAGARPTSDGPLARVHGVVGPLAVRCRFTTLGNAEDR
jgi:Fic family protein